MARLQRKEIYPLIDIQINGQIAQKRRIRTYIKSCIAYLSPRLRKDVRIELNVLTTLEESAYAHCYGDRNGVQIDLARCSGHLKFSLEEQMLNLAHELVHAKQFIKGDLSPVRFKYKTKDYSRTPYSRQPWELEAYRKEEKLFQTFWL
jgi:hypothetical protein